MEREGRDERGRETKGTGGKEREGGRGLTLLRAPCVISRLWMYIPM